MGTGKMKKMSRQQQKAVGASMNEAAGKMLSPLGFGTAGLFTSSKHYGWWWYERLQPTYNDR